MFAPAVSRHRLTSREANMRFNRVFTPSPLETPLVHPLCQHVPDDEVVATATEPDAGAGGMGARCRVVRSAQRAASMRCCSNLRPTSVRRWPAQNSELAPIAANAGRVSAEAGEEETAIAVTI